MSYSHKDEAWKDRVHSQLGVLVKGGFLDVWDDRRIRAGDTWRHEIGKSLAECEAAILLVSADFLNSDFILNTEVPTLLERRSREGVRVIPLIIRPCAWQKIPWLSELNARPKDGKALSGGSEHTIEADLAALAAEVHDILGPTAPPAIRVEESTRVSASRLPTTAGRIFGRDAELNLLDECWAEESANVLAVVAWGGVGKSALVNSWLQSLDKDGYKGARRVFAWSFYSQGTQENIPTADLFIEAALNWFGDEKPMEGTSWEKGVRLADLVRRSRTVLILDGIEPLLYPPGPREGRLKDQALTALIKELARANNGLCIITTRFPLADLETFEPRNARRLNLETLSDKAGADLLVSMGTKGTQAELETAAREFGGHALALTLLGSYLADVHNGNISKIREIGPLETDVRYGGHARRVLDSYERWFGASPETDILHMLGVFDRPAPIAALDAIRLKPPVFGLTEHVSSLGPIEFAQALAKLKRARLLTEVESPNRRLIDTHPLVREHFGEKLRRGNAASWVEANRRVYIFLRDSTPELPQTLEEMAPLIAAIGHACRANMHVDALNEVYRPRLVRESNNYTTSRLGGYGTIVAALSGFFERPWEGVAKTLPAKEKTYVKTEVAFGLWQLGKLTDARLLYEQALSESENRNDTDAAAVIAGSLSQINLAQGNIGPAVSHGRAAVKFAMRTMNAFRRYSARSHLADALHQAGELKEAEIKFREAEDIKKAHDRPAKFLDSIAGYRYCDLLLSLNREDEVLKRGEYIHSRAKTYGAVRDQNLGQLAIARSHIRSAQRGEAADLPLAAENIAAVIAFWRETGLQEKLAQALLHRGELRELRKDLAGAQADFIEAKEISERSGMGLVLADSILAQAKLSLSRGEVTAARSAYETARGMIEKAGYNRRLNELQDLENRLRQIPG